MGISARFCVILQILCPELGGTAFTDLDLDLEEIGGDITWTSPDVLDEVAGRRGDHKLFLLRTVSRDTVIEDSDSVLSRISNHQNYPE